MSIFFPWGRCLITGLYGVCVYMHVSMCACGGAVGVCPPERVLAKLSSGAAPVSSPVIIMSPSPCLTEHGASAVL